MTADQRDEAMIEIGDMDDDSTPEPVGPARVVIEYRDRGIPWVLVPPLLALAGVVCVVVVYSVRAYYGGRPAAFVNQPPPAVIASANPATPADPVPVYADVTSTPTSPVVPTPAAVRPDLAPPNTPMVPAPGVLDELTLTQNLTAPTDPATQVTTVTPTPEPIPTLGFDLSALRPEAPSTPSPASAPVAAPAPAVVRYVESPFGTGPMIDPGITSASAGVESDDATPSRPVATVTPDQPEPPQPVEVAANLLPPDPNQGAVERQRELLQERRKIEAERFVFQRELREIYQQQGANAAPTILALMQASPRNVPPGAMEQANKMLGKTGMYNGVGTSVRISLLRRLGFPEPKILAAILDLEARHYDSGARNAPSRDALIVRSALILLNNRLTPPTTTVAAPAPSR